MDREKLNALITVLGEKPIELVFELVGDEKISFAKLRAWVRRRHIIKAMKEGHSFTRIAQRFGISRMTVYRIFNAERRLRKSRR